ncbi:E3 ubiquitin-protein ligase RGLG3 isoform X2 [Cryptomeria japonica]|nr:E3 ubiquitin-protein ligase RGLG3 isoform X2 [Cryptomeria japonica]
MHKYAFIGDNFQTLDQVITALRDNGLESSNLIVGIDFTKSNEWTGRDSFNGQSLHAIGDIPNPYEQAISIIGQTLSPFDEDNLIPCFGFGDVSTHDYTVFSFYEDHRPCHGFEEALSRYRQIVPHLSLSGPTSFAPIIQIAMDIVEKSGGQYHVLVIVADGQVSKSSNPKPGQLSPQEQKTIEAIVAASQYPLSIVLVGVGDGPWEAMQHFDDNIPRRLFDNFQFVNFTKLMSRNPVQSQKEAEFALAALMETPFQYKATMELNILGRQVGKVPNVEPFRPPPSVISHDASLSSSSQPSISQSTASESTILGGISQAETNLNSERHVEISSPSTIYSLSSQPSISQPTASESTSQGGISQPETNLDRDIRVCPICLTKTKDMAFGCGHMTCRECSQYLSNCPICRACITTRLRLYGT